MWASTLPRYARPVGCLRQAVSLRSAIVFDLRLGDDAGLEGVSQDDVFMRKMRLKEFVEPSPMPAAIWRL